MPGREERCVAKLPISVVIEAAVGELARCDQPSLIAVNFQLSLASAGCDLQVCGLRFLTVKAGLSDLLLGVSHTRLRGRLKA